MTEYRDLFRKADQKQLMADYLMQQGASPIQMPQGAVTPEYGIGHGFTDIAQALLAKRAGKKADSAYSQADQARQRAMAQSLMGMQQNQMGPPQDPFVAAQGAIDAGADPGIVGMQLQSSDREPLVLIETANGPMYVRRSDAVGQAPPSAGTKPIDTGTYNPRDYTTESFANFLESEDPRDLVRFERLQKVDLGGGRTGLFDSETGNLLETIDEETFVENTRSAKSAAASGSAEGSAVTAAQVELEGLNRLDSQLQNMMSNPDFDASVGAVDNLTGRIGQLWGSEEGELGAQASRLMTELITQAASTWKGAISERELDLFINSAPSRSTSANGWRKWYQEEFLPRKRQIERTAGGQSFPIANQSENVTSSGVRWSFAD